MSQTSLADRIANLEQLTLAQLWAEYRQAFGRPTRAHNRRQLVRQIAWRWQALAEGDLSQRARRRADELANDADLRITAPARSDKSPNRRAKKRRTRRRKPMPGTLLRRPYKDRMIEVRVLDEGFEHGGQLYATLSSVAKAITGSHWNGYHFFGLTKQENQS